MGSDSHPLKDGTLGDFDPLALTADPHAFYRKLREKGPHNYKGQWLLARHADVASVLSDSRFVYPEGDLESFSGGADWIDLVSKPSEDLVPRIRDKCAELSWIWIFRRNDADHARIRNLLRTSFTRERLQTMRPRAQAIADDLLARCQGRSRIEMISTFAHPLPLTVISEVVGVPVALGQMRTWARDLAMSLSANTDSTITERGFFAIAGLAEFIRKAMPARAHDAHGLLGNLLAAVARGELTRDELISNCAAMLVAGHVTTQHLIGTSILLLLQHPEQLQLLREDPSLAANAVEEVLRFEPPVQSVRRIAREDISVGGVTIHSGERVISLIVAANRDPEVVLDAHRFDITRSPIQVFSFGGGSHFCLGANLARLETEIALQSLVRHFPRLKLEWHTPDWEQKSLFRGLETLHVVVE
nr:biotin biosynthesis cytochrome P450 [uncultured bacterium]